MTFIEVLHGLKEGKKYSMIGNDNSFIYIDKRNRVIRFKHYFANINIIEKDFSLDIEDAMSEKWKETTEFEVYQMGKYGQIISGENL